MADRPETPAGATPEERASTDPATVPRLMIQSQYVKDLSFENPRAPLSLQSGQRPEIQVRIDVNARPLEAERYEVMLELHVEARVDNASAFMVELTYGGVFGLLNIPPDSLQPLLLIECPRLLFPFARRVVADATRDGGFPPLLIDPVDFVSLYRRRHQAAAAASDAPAIMPAAGDGAAR
jgi:preprotein translocase subunit SecB